MPKRTDISSVMVIGSGPIVIGQACEFDYSGTQACRALRQEGYRVILVNSNPATIMTDPEFADATYIEPITPEFVERIIARERPDALLANMGGQTGLNMAVSLARAGVLERYGVELIGADLDAIERAEDREKFKEAVTSLTDFPGGAPEVARSYICHSVDEVLAAAEQLTYPVVLRPSFTLGGVGSGFAHDAHEARTMAEIGLEASPATEVLVEESILGWKEIELELIRDRDDQFVIVCTIENFDPMGVHTGDSITVAPALTLTDKEVARLCDMGKAIMRAVGLSSGGCNIQYAVHPDTGRVIVVEMNPRVSRSSALASKATGYPIAKVAAKLAMGYTLAEITNDVTGCTSAADGPSIDYIVVKVPRFAFEKFAGADDTLTTHMKSVGEVMAIGRNFTEALGKALRSLEDARAPLPLAGPVMDAGEALAAAARPHDGRLQMVIQALRAGATVDDIYKATMIDPWFLDQLQLVVDVADEVSRAPGLTIDLLRLAKRHGLSDAQIGELRGMTAEQVRSLRWAMNVRPVFKTVDTCAGLHPARTAYHYSTYDEQTEVVARTKPAVLILGSGPNRIGQGIEFDYSCVHASLALAQAGYETVMVNCNPETVSTDYDTSDRLYFEPLTQEDVLEVYAAEAVAGPVAGVIVQLGGQTPLKLAAGLKAAGLPLIGTSPESIDLAEDRGAFGRVLADAHLPAPRYGMATSAEEARRIAADIVYPVLVRPSYVLGGRGMEIVYDDATLNTYVTTVTTASKANPVMIDKFLDDATEIDVDALFDGQDLYIGGIMEHIEEAGVHSGDSACAWPPITLGAEVIERIRLSTRAIAEGVGVRGLINIQYALAGDTLYVLEANPRASRTIPFVSKATNVPLAKAAALVMAGATIKSLRVDGVLNATGDGSTPAPEAPVAVKEAVMPFNRFQTAEGAMVDNLLGPEMRSTGEVMGLDPSFGIAFAKSQTASYGSLPTSGTVFVSVANADKRHAILPVQMLADMGFAILATTGTADVLQRNGIAVTRVRKRSEGVSDSGEATVVDLILDHKVDLVINTPYSGATSGSTRRDGYGIRSAAVMADIPCVTTIQGLIAVVQGIAATRKDQVTVRPLQEWGPLMRPVS